MKIDESETVKAARDRMDANRDGKLNMQDLEASGIRDKIIDFFGMILWVSLILGTLGALLTLVWNWQPFLAITQFVATIVSVGVGFVVLDIRDRLIGRK